MVVLVDLCDDGDALDPPADPRQSRFHQVALRQRTSQPKAPVLVDRPNPNMNGFSAALACYPIAIQIVRSLDLNDLHALSRTCRQIHCNLRQFRASLIPCTLRCINESPDRDPADLATLHAPDPARSIRARLTSGRVGPCAHDLVSPCQRCGHAVCRNCVARVQPARLLQRHRRLCTACLQAPLPELTGLAALLPGPASRSAFTAPAYAHTACACPDGAYLCRPCGLGLPSADTMYRRIWTWRTRYSREGIGTGIGEGTEGVKCARGQACVAAQEIEVELDCGPDDEAPASPQSDSATEIMGGGAAGGAAVEGSPGAPGTPVHEDRGDAGYMRQEIEGIGGVVRGKVKKRIRVGRPVREFEDERERAVFLEREVNGERRSWCGWCDRVIPGRGDAGAGGIGM